MIIREFKCYKRKESYAHLQFYFQEEEVYLPLDGEPELYVISDAEAVRQARAKYPLREVVEWFDLRIEDPSVYATPFGIQIILITRGAKREWKNLGQCFADPQKKAELERHLTQHQRQFKLTRILRHENPH